jgi:hypothetical protein
MTDEEITRDLKKLNLYYTTYGYSDLDLIELIKKREAKAKADARKDFIEIVEEKFKWTTLKSPKKWKQIKQSLGEKTE